MHQGFVVYAGNNSRLKSWAFRDLGGKLVGYLATHTDGNLIVAASKVKGRKRYTVSGLYGPSQDIEAPAELKGTMDALSPGTETVIGRLKKEETVDASGGKVIRRDSSGMFEAVALKLKKLYSLPGNLVKEFANVHDDLAEGGTKADSRKNFFDVLKAAPGVGGASELDFFAYCGHGNASGLPSAGVDRTHVAALAKEIKRLLRADGTVIFYACQTGSKDGLAQKLSGLLPSMTVWGHRKSGPASTNPYKKKYVGGVEQPFRDSWGEADQVTWDAYMRASADFYARYPFMTLDQISAEVGLSFAPTAVTPSQPATQAPADPKKRGWNPLRGFKPAAVH